MPKEEKPILEEVKEEVVPEEESSEDEDKFDDEIEGGEWVTEENIHKHISGGNTQSLMENADNLLFTIAGEKNPEEAEAETQPESKEGDEN